MAVAHACSNVLLCGAVCDFMKLLKGTRTTTTKASSNVKTSGNDDGNDNDNENENDNDNDNYNDNENDKDSDNGTGTGTGTRTETHLITTVAAPAKGKTVWYSSSIPRHCPPQVIAVTGT